MKVNKIQGNVNHQAVGVLNKISRDANNIPTHMTEARTYAEGGNLSANLGTERESQNGWCYQSNLSAKVHTDKTFIISRNFALEFWIDISEISTTGQGDIFHKAYTSHVSPYYFFRCAVTPVSNAIALLLISTTGLSTTVSIPYSDGNLFTKAKIRFEVDFDNLLMTATSFRTTVTGGSDWTTTMAIPSDRVYSDYNTELYMMGSRNGSFWQLPTGVKVWDLQFFDFTTSANDFKYNCQETSGTTCYDSSGNGNHGSVVNYYEGFHAEQDVYSSLDEEGYTYWGNLTDRLSNVIVGDIITFDITTKDTIAVLLNNTYASDDYFAVIHQGSSALFQSSNFTGSLYVDGNLISPTTTRGQLYTLISDGNKHTLKCIIATRRGTSDVAIGYHQDPTYYLQGSIENVLHTNASGGVKTSEIRRLLPKDSSITLPPFKDVLGNDLQYIGKVPTKGEIVGGKCFSANGTGRIGTVNTGKIPNGILTVKFKYKTDGTGINNHICSADNGVTNQRYFQIRQPATPGSISMVVIKYPFTVLSTTGIILPMNEWVEIEAIFNTSTGMCTLSDGTSTVSIDFASSLGWAQNLYMTYVSRSTGIEILSEGQIDDIRIDDNDGRIQRLSFSEPLVNPGTHIYHDISGNGKHATLVNGSLANEGVKSIAGDWLQNGVYIDGSGNYVPILEDFSAFADGTALSSGIQQDGYSFLNAGSFLEMCRTPRIVNSDKDHFWFISKDTDNFIKRQVTTYDLAVENLVSDQLFCNTNEN